MKTPLPILIDPDRAKAFLATLSPTQALQFSRIAADDTSKYALLGIVLALAEEAHSVGRLPNQRS